MTSVERSTAPLLVHRDHRGRYQVLRAGDAPLEEPETVRERHERRAHDMRHAAMDEAAAALGAAVRLCAGRIRAGWRRAIQAMAPGRLRLRA